eukprot:Colp12_sorted_trinity150504_noHs@13159
MRNLIVFVVLALLCTFVQAYVAPPSNQDLSAELALLDELMLADDGASLTVSNPEPTGVAVHAATEALSGSSGASATLSNGLIVGIAIGAALCIGVVGLSATRLRQRSRRGTR